MLTNVVPLWDTWNHSKHNMIHGNSPTLGCNFTKHLIKSPMEVHYITFYSNLIRWIYAKISILIIVMKRSIIFGLIPNTLSKVKNQIGTQPHLHVEMSLATLVRESRSAWIRRVLFISYNLGWTKKGPFHKLQEDETSVISRFILLWEITSSHTWITSTS